MKDVWTGLKALRGATAATETLGEVTAAIVKHKLPTEFLDALKTFGKSEDEILDYFMKYHNDNGFKFFNEMDNILANNTYNLTQSEAYTLWGYTTNYFYGNLNM